MYLEWDLKVGSVILVFLVFGFLSIVFIFGVFYKYWNSVVVKVFICEYLLLILIMIVCMFLFFLLYVGKVIDIVCKV